MSEDDKMFRYLLKYVGKYRVLTELTTDTNDYVRDEDGNIASDYDELYIPCANEGKIKHTYSDSILAYITDKKQTFKKIVSQLKEDKISCELDDFGDEYIIYFNDADMPKVAKIVRAQTKGKKEHPLKLKKDVVVVPKKKTQTVIKYAIPNEDKSLYYKAMSVIKDRKTKLDFKNKVTDDFVKSLNDEEFYAKRDKLQMGTQEYIHYSGKWDKYINYIKEKIV